jgi:type II secretory pathway pseudopilin PulG
MKGRDQGTGRRDQNAEQGFILLALIVAIVLIMLVLGLAAPRVAQEMRREREVETEHRGQQYVRAIQLYYRKFGHYPGSMEQLAKTNNIRFLRQQYVDPITGLADWRTIPVGQNKTTVKGFFGQPLAGIASAGLGSAAGMASGGTAGAAATAGVGVGANGAATTGSGPAGGAVAAGATGGAGTSPGGTPDPAAGQGTTFGIGSSSGLGSAAGIGSSTPSSFGGAGSPFMGVGLNATGESILENNEQTTYNTWEFLYDPRIETLKAKNSLLGGPAAGAGLGGTNGLGGTTGIGAAGGTGGTNGTGATTGSGTTGNGGTGTGGTGTGGMGTQPPQ